MKKKLIAIAVTLSILALSISGLVFLNTAAASGWQDGTITLTPSYGPGSLAAWNGVNAINYSSPTVPNVADMFDVFRFAESMDIPVGTVIPSIQVDWEYDTDTVPSSIGVFYVHSASAPAADKHDILVQDPLSWVDTSKTGWRMATVYTGTNFTVGDYTTTGNYTDINFASNTFYHIDYIVVTVNDGTNTFTATWGTPAPVNVALGKTAYADHSEVQNTPPRLPGLAVDGDTGGSNSRWSSGDSSSDPVIDHWWMVDLGASYDLTGVELYWEAAFAKDYEIQISDTDPGVTADDQGTCGDSGDFSSFTTIYSEDNNTTGGHQTIDLTGTGRYLRILCHEGYVVSVPPAFYGYSLFEVEVYGTPTPPPPVPTLEFHSNTIGDWTETPTNALRDYLGSSAIKFGKTGDSDTDGTDNWFNIRVTGIEDKIYDNVTLKASAAGSQWVQFQTYVDSYSANFTEGTTPHDYTGTVSDQGNRWRPWDSGFQWDGSAGNIFENAPSDSYTVRTADNLKMYLGSDKDFDINFGGLMYIRGIQVLIGDQVVAEWGTMGEAPTTTTTEATTTTTATTTTKATTTTTTATTATATDTTTGTETGTTDTATTAAPTTVTHTTAAPTTTASETTAPTDDARTLLTNAVGAALTADQLAGYTDADAVAAYTAALANANAALANANATDQELTDALTALNNAKTALDNTLTTAAPTTTATAPSQTGVGSNLIPVGILGIAALGLTAVLAKKKSQK